MNLRLEYDSFEDFASRLWPSLCEEGMWIRSDTPGAVGELVDFDALLADGFRLFHGTGQVIAVGSGPEGPSAGQGMTLRFGQLDQPSRNLVRKVVSKYVGEGGKPYVLSAPGTKIEVVGGEGDAPRADQVGGVVAGMVPEDPMVPFPELESGSEWSDSAEPELTSFLRPSGKAADGDSTVAEPESVPALDLTTDPAPPAEAEPFPATDLTVDPAASAEPEAPVDEASEEESPALGAPLVDEPLVEPPDFGTFESMTSGFGSSEAPEPPEVEEPESPAPPFGQLGEDFEQSLAESQVVDLLTSDKPAERAPIPFELETPEVEPHPSIAVSPPPMAPDAGQSRQGFELHPAAAIDEPEVTSTGRSVWLYLLVAIVAIGAALLIATQFDTPLSSLFGGEAGTEGAADTGEAMGAESAGAEFEVVAGPPSGGAGPDDAGAEPTTAGAEPTTAGIEDDAIDPPAPSADVMAQSSAPPEATADKGSPALDSPSADPPATRPSVAVAVAPAEASPTPVEETPSASADLEPLRLDRITWWTVGDDTVVRLWLDGKAGPERLESLPIVTGAPRFVVKLTGVAGPVPRDPVPIGSAHVDQLRFGVHPSPEGWQLHAVADLTDSEVELVGTVAVDEGGLELRFSRP